MIQNENQYRKVIARTLNKLNELKNASRPSDVKLRYIYRIKDSGDPGDKTKYYTERIVIADKTKVEVLERLIEDFEKKREENISVHLNYNLNYPITRGAVGILNEESYPEELKSLVEELSSQPSSDPKRRSVKKSNRKLDIPIAYSIEFNGIYYIKTIEKIKIASGKKLEKSLIFGTKSQRIVNINQDLLVIVLTEPDLVIYSKLNEEDPAFVYSSHKLGTICATYEYMRRKIRESKGELDKVLDDSTSLLNYLDKEWNTVHTFYFALKSGDLSILDNNYIDILKKKFLGDRIQMNSGGKLITQHLSGKDIYCILTCKYGTLVNRKGEEEKGIVESFNRIQSNV